MDNYPVNLNDNLESLPQLKQLFDGSRGPNGQSAHDQDFGVAARAEIAKLGAEPSLTDVASMVMSGILECKADIKSVQGVLAQSVGLNTQKIDLHDRQLSWLKQNATNNDVKLDAALKRIDVLESSAEDIKVMKEKHYKNICETRQRSVKGNFILSGQDIPRMVQGENLFAITAQIIWDKYGISLDWYQLKALHRMPSGGIILVTTNRLPGSMFEHLMRAVNGNPNRHIRAYINIQLMEPFDALHYVARKLKFFKVISNYRLDENGYTWIAISEDKSSFKFTSIRQLVSLGVSMPDGLRKDVEEYQERRAQREKEAEQKNLERGSQPRNIRPSFPSSNPSGGPTLPPTHTVSQQNNPTQLAATNQFTVPPPTPNPPPRQAAPRLTGGNTEVQVPRPRQPNPAPPGPTLAPPLPPSGSAGGESHRGHGGTTGSGSFLGRSQTSSRPQRSPREQNRREFQDLRNQFEPRTQHEQRGANRLINPYMSDLERNAYNLAEELGLSPGATASDISDWSLGID